MTTHHTGTHHPQGRCRRRQALQARIRGWTLAELLITLGVMSVLAALALPTFQKQQRLARRGDGQAALLQLQVDQARWRSRHERYAQSLSELGWVKDRSPQGHYQITLTEASSDTYTALATAVDDQTADQPCNPLRLTWRDSATAVWGAGDHMGSDPERCWRR